MAIISDTLLRLPQHLLVERVVVDDCFDAAEDWIAERADAAAVVVTADSLLADRCFKASAVVVAPSGRPFASSSIGNAVPCGQSWRT